MSVYATLGRIGQADGGSNQTEDRSVTDTSPMIGEDGHLAKHWPWPVQSLSRASMIGTSRNVIRAAPGGPPVFGTRRGKPYAERFAIELIDWVRENNFPAEW